MLRSTIICPNCRSASTRKSRWRRGEKERHFGSRPIRCRQCAHRFFIADRRLLLAVIFAPVVITLAAAALLWPKERADEAGMSTLVSVAADPQLAKEAAAGDAKAQLRLGKALLGAAGAGAQSGENALRWLRLAMADGNTEAMVALGQSFIAGVGAPQDLPEAAKWFRLAALQGNSEGMLELGRLYRDGIGVEQDRIQAYVWFSRASARNNRVAEQERGSLARALAPAELKKAQELSAAQ